MRCAIILLLGISPWPAVLAQETASPSPEATPTAAPQPTGAPGLAGLPGLQAAGGAELPDCAGLAPGSQEAQARQQAEAQRRGLPLEAVNSLGARLRFIPEGEFVRGSPAGELGRGDDEAEAQRPARIASPFFLWTTEVTQSQWQAVMGDNPSQFPGATNPVENVSWDDGQEFIRRLNEREGLTAETGYRLPTEAEWEYACRAGTATAYYAGDGDEALAAIAWQEANSGGKTMPAAQLAANAWGLYDMSGNVWEWCADYSGDSGRANRGGSWRTPARFCRSATSEVSSQDQRNGDRGFRLARTIPPSKGSRAR